MIARVKIAPVEHWCKFYLDELSKDSAYAKLVGKQVEIETSRTWEVEAEHGTPGRKWAITKQLANKLRRACGSNKTTPFQEALCEHMLEMD